MRFLFVAGVRRGEERNRYAEAIYIGHNDGRTADVRTCSWKMRSSRGPNNSRQKRLCARKRCRRAHCEPEKKTVRDARRETRSHERNAIFRERSTPLSSRTHLRDNARSHFHVFVFEMSVENHSRSKINSPKEKRHITAIYALRRSAVPCARDRKFSRLRSSRISVYLRWGISGD